jgi:hypothetical protein
MLYVCSLKVERPQTVPAGGSYHLIRFPYVGTEESYDPHNMHHPSQPDGVTSAWPDARSGLIWPAASGWGWLTGMVFWEAGSSGEYRARFARDPLNLTTGADTTATTDEAPTPGGQYRHYCHEMFVHPGTPIGLMVRHAASGGLDVTLAEFKLAISTDLAPLPTGP